jgi:hypothetical protein
LKTIPASELANQFPTRPRREPDREFDVSERRIAELGIMYLTTGRYMDDMMVMQWIIGEDEFEHVIVSPNLRPPGIHVSIWDKQ